MSPTLVTNLFEQVGGRGLVVQADLLTRSEWGDALQSLKGRLHGRPLIVQGVPPTAYSDLPRLEDLAEHGPSIEQQDHDPGRLSLVISTGGTTGRPKSVMHCENTVVYSAREFAKALHYTDADVHVAFGPYGHASGSIHEIYLPLMYGASVLPNSRWQPFEVAQAIARFGGTCCITVGTHMFDLLAMDRSADLLLRSLRLVTSGAGPDHLYENAERRFGFKVVRVFGLSECLGHAVGRPDDPPEVRWHADGVPFPGIESLILDPEGRPASSGVVGEYAVRGPSLFMGYYGQPDLTAASLTSQGFYRTGDLMVRDDNGYITWSGRLKDVIRRGGLQIDATELENLLEQHDSVREVVVVGEPDPRLSERAVIVVVPHADRPRPTLDDLTAHLRGNGIPKEGLPERLLFRDSLPRTEFGKFHRAEIKAWLLTQAVSEPD
jgi:acyl-CoA synthetase (AMP-forming)/AMP-acid ligase II